jgi:hypothetical protein
MKCRHHTGLGLGLALAALLLQGCAASGSPTWDAQFGDSVRRLGAQQLIDPNAPQRNGDAQGPTDGRTARETRDRYIESYTTPPVTNVLTTGIGNR